MWVAVCCSVSTRIYKATQGCLAFIRQPRVYQMVHGKWPCTFIYECNCPLDLLGAPSHVHGANKMTFISELQCVAVCPLAFIRQPRVYQMVHGKWPCTFINECNCSLDLLGASCHGATVYMVPQVAPCTWRVAYVHSYINVIVLAMYIHIWM